MFVSLVSLWKTTLPFRQRHTDMDFSDAITMESSQVVQGADGGCNSSSESGWTMYIGSPTSENESLSDEDAREQHEFSGGEEDDSMASDASSGPMRRRQTPDRRHKNHLAQDHKPSRPNNNYKQVMMRSQDNSSPQEELVISNAATGFSRIRGGGKKVRKNNLG